MTSLLHLQRIKAEARAAVLARTGKFDQLHTDQSNYSKVTAAQSFLRAVSAEFHRRLREAGIEVETNSDD